MVKELSELVWNDILERIVNVDESIPESITPVSGIVNINCVSSEEEFQSYLNNRAPENANSYMAGNMISDDCFGYVPVQFYKIE